MILVSACLVGCPCRYDNSHCAVAWVEQLVAAGAAYPICPEQLAGLATPRDPSEIINQRVMTIRGKDVTAAFWCGARRSLAIAKALNADRAILKRYSPSCGYQEIYDGSFSGTLTAGNGVTAQLLTAHRIAVYNETAAREFAKDSER